MMVVIYNEVNKKASLKIQVFAGKPFLYKNLPAEYAKSYSFFKNKNLARFFYVEYTKKEYKQKSTEETGEIYE